jgi:hypothetical protein
MQKPRYLAAILEVDRRLNVRDRERLILPRGYGVTPALTDAKSQVKKKGSRNRLYGSKAETSTFSE